MLFADMAGALSAWGMNIVKADAFSNSAGVIVDSFQFTDPFRTLELNPGEHERFLISLRSALSGRTEVEAMLRARKAGRSLAGPQSSAGGGVHFDDESSSHSTLLQVIAPDSPGLLRSLAQAIAACGCNIEVALIDTEGELAIDVFYLTAGGRKLAVQEQICIAQRIERAFTLIADVPGAAKAHPGGAT